MNSAHVFHQWSAIFFVVVLAILGECLIAAGMRRLGDLGCRQVEPVRLAYAQTGMGRLRLTANPLRHLLGEGRRAASRNHGNMDFATFCGHPGYRATTPQDLIVRMRRDHQNSTEGRAHDRTVPAGIAFTA